MSKKFQIEKQETHYTALKMNLSEYDELRIVEDVHGRIKIQFNHDRWRTTKDTIKLLEELAGILKNFDRLNIIT